MAKGHSTTLYDFKYEVSPPPSSEWVQIWRIGLASASVLYTSLRPDSDRDIKSLRRITPIGDTNSWPTSSYNVDFYLQDNSIHIIKLEVVTTDYYGNHVQYTKEDGTTMYGTRYINVGTGMAGVTIQTTYTEYYDYGFMFFKKPPEGDFKTWLKKYCQQIM